LIRFLAALGMTFWLRIYPIALNTP